jgi:hypothetical protein
MAFRTARAYEVDAEEGGYNSEDSAHEATKSASEEQCCYEYRQKGVDVKLSNSSEYLQAVVFENKSLQTVQIHQLVQGFLVSDMKSTSGRVYEYSIVQKITPKSLKMEAVVLWEVRNDDRDKQSECMKPLQKWALDNNFFFIDYT